MLIQTQDFRYTYTEAKHILSPHSGQLQLLHSLHFIITPKMREQSILEQSHVTTSELNVNVDVLRILFRYCRLRAQEEANDRRIDRRTTTFAHLLRNAA